MKPSTFLFFWAIIFIIFHSLMVPSNIWEDIMLSLITAIGFGPIIQSLDDLYDKK